MSRMINKYRLSSNNYERETDAEKIAVKKIYYLAVEGNIAEPKYFDGVSKFREKIGIDYRVDVHVLKRAKDDTKSAPKYVLELLEEYIRLREKGIDSYEELKKNIPELSEGFYNMFDESLIRSYVEDDSTIDVDAKKILETELKKLGFDIEYRKWLKYMVQDEDEFGIVFDRDKGSNTKEGIEEIINHCKEKGYGCYINNPCFEIWLLMHYRCMDDYKDHINELQENKKQLDQHSYISKELSDIAGLGKNNINFEKNYLPYVRNAVKRAKDYDEGISDPAKHIDDVGSNLWDFFEHLGID